VFALNDQGENRKRLGLCKLIMERHQAGLTREWKLSRITVEGDFSKRGGLRRSSGYHSSGAKKKKATKVADAKGGLVTSKQKTGTPRSGLDSFGGGGPRRVPERGNFTVGAQGLFKIFESQASNSRKQ